MSDNKINIQWYPGHMTKAKRMMLEDIKLIDLVIEIVDARIPVSSRNPDISAMAENKLRVIILNKADLASPKATEEWIRHYESLGAYAVALDARNRSSMNSVKAIIAKACAAKKERDRKKGILNRPVRAMVVGIPNVGKSTFINSYANKACAKTGNKPGVGVGKQRIRLNKDVELLATPGILWPKFEDETVGVHLAWIGTINDQIIDMTELSLHLIEYLKTGCEGCLKERYDVTEQNEPAQILSEIAKKRGCLKKGGEPDTDKAVRILFDDFRSGRLGRFTIELPGENKND